MRATAKAVGGYPREVSRVGKRFLEGGVEHALSDDPRPKPPRLLDSSQEAAIVALACGPPPAGRAKWSTKKLAREAVRRGIVPKVGRETVRLVSETRNNTASRKHIAPLHVSPNYPAKS